MLDNGALRLVTNRDPEIDLRLIGGGHAPGPRLAPADVVGPVDLDKVVAHAKCQIMGMSEPLNGGATIRFHAEGRPSKQTIANRSRILALFHRVQQLEDLSEFVAAELAACAALDEAKTMFPAMRMTQAAFRLMLMAWISARRARPRRSEMARCDATFEGSEQIREHGGVAP